MYEVNTAKTIINSCDTYIYLGGTDIDTAMSIAKRCDEDVQHILELPYGKEYFFQKNEKAKLVDVFPINGLLPMRVLDAFASVFELCEEQSESFQELIEKISTS